MSFNWLNNPIKKTDQKALQDALSRQQQLTKPPGSLGELESVVIRLAAMQGKQKPQLEKINIVIFAADHGIAAENVSAFPQSVTLEMIRNFSAGGAAICVIAKELNANLDVINLGTVDELEPLQGVSDCRLGSGTKNFAVQEAMSQEQLSSALTIGSDMAGKAKASKVDMFIGGEMGIANTSSATAMAAVLLKLNPTEITGAGTGLDEHGVKHKVKIIEQALSLHAEKTNGQALDILRCLGGFEIAALCGAYIRCGQEGIPVLVDGFISSVAALLACELKPSLCDWLIFSHESAEPGHKLVLQALQANSLLNLGMRLGEGSGAGVAVPLLRMACALHNNMATFADAEVAEKIR